MINTYELETVMELYRNITLHADDHPRYNVIVEAYEARLNATKE